MLFISVRKVWEKGFRSGLLRLYHSGTTLDGNVRTIWCGCAYLPLGELPLHQRLVLEEILGAVPGNNAFLETRLEVFLAPVVLPQNFLVLGGSNVVHIAVPC